jgi:hypothetical protein
MQTQLVQSVTSQWTGIGNWELGELHGRRSAQEQEAIHRLSEWDCKYGSHMSRSLEDGQTRLALLCFVGALTHVLHGGLRAWTTEGRMGRTLKGSRQGLDMRRGVRTEAIRIQ